MRTLLRKAWLKIGLLFDMHVAAGYESLGIFLYDYRRKFVPLVPLTEPFLKVFEMKPYL